MSTPQVEITCRQAFSASHQLCDPALSPEENERVFGACSRLHGHNYELAVSVLGPVSTATGMVMDLTRLGELVQEQLIGPVEHCHLNRDVSFLRGLVPTAENLAVRFWERLEPCLEPFEGCRLSRIRVYESRTSYADYRGRAPAG